MAALVFGDVFPRDANIEDITKQIRSELKIRVIIIIRILQVGPLRLMHSFIRQMTTMARIGGRHKGRRRDLARPQS